METIKKYGGPVFGLGLFSVALWFLYLKVQEITWQEFTDGLSSISPVCLALGAVLVAINYSVLIGNDWLAVEYSAGQDAATSEPGRLSFGRVALASFLGYAFANNIGAVAAGIPIRARFYGSWGLGPARIAKLIAFLSLSFWVGFGVIGGLFLSLVDVPVPDDVELPVSSRVLGVALLLVTAAYAGICILWHRPLRLGKAELNPPGMRLMLRQMLVASLDLIIVTATLYVLLPQGTAASYPEVATVYLLALAAAMLTQVPGGLGVLEVILMGLLAGSETEVAVLGSLLIFRIYYYVFPLLLGAIILIAAEAAARSSSACTKREDIQPSTICEAHALEGSHDNSSES